MMKAKTTRTTFSRTTTVSIGIHSDPSIIWALLTQAADYPRWNSTVTALNGTIATGEKISLRSVLDPKRTFRLRITELEPEKRMVWSGGQGSRVFSLQKQGSGGTIFTMTETIGGLAFPLYARFIPSFDSSFDRFAEDLKKEAETIMNSK